MSSNKIDFGIDAPGLVRFFFGAGLASATLAVLAILFLRGDTIWLLLSKSVLAIVAIYLIGMGSLMLYWSKFKKVQMRKEIFDMVQWRGDEHVLDIGCGRGLMLIGAAERLTTGRAIGIDTWEAKDQSANSLQAALENVRLASVQDSAQVQTADCRHLPFKDQSFDIVVSHWVVHNLPSEEDRNLAIFEMARVLRAEGKLILCDIENRGSYLAALRLLGLSKADIIFNPVADLILGALSFGSFRPFTIICTKAP
jgi:arsenite methyltransferase